MRGSGDSERSVRLAFVGDICLAGGLQAQIEEHGVRYPFERIRDAFNSADLVIGNLECCISEASPGSGYAPNSMIVPAHIAAGLGETGIQVVSLANNHTMDGGVAGLSSTQRFLDREGILCFGAGTDIEEAERPLLVECRGVTVAFLGACDVSHCFATPKLAGVAPLNAKRLRRRIAEGRRKASIVVVSIHADLEFTPYPSPGRVRLSRWLTREGADIVVQHHPHVSQGIEVQSGKVIAYSLGNFIFRVHGNEYLEGRRGTDWGLMMKVNVLPGLRPQLLHSIEPVSINSRNQTEPSSGQLRAAQLEAVEEMSIALLDGQFLRRQRVARCILEAKTTLYSLYYLGCRKGVLSMLSAGLKILISPYERRWMYSLLSGGWVG